MLSNINPNYRVLFFYIIFFSIEISNSEGEIFKYESQMNFNFLIGNKTNNILTYSLLLVYYIYNFTTISFFIIITSIFIEIRFLHNSPNIKFCSENEILIDKKMTQKKIVHDNLDLYLIRINANFSKY